MRHCKFRQTEISLYCPQLLSWSPRVLLAALTNDAELLEAIVLEERI